MKLRIDKSFQKDYNNIKDKIIVQNINNVLAELYNMQDFRMITNCKKMIGYKNAYRIKVGKYRIGFVFEEESLIMIRCLPRKDIYKFFP